MHFFISCGLSLMCVTALLFLPAQGTQGANPSALLSAARPNVIDIHLPCCHNVSTAYIRGAVKACYEQKEDRFPDCKIHAFILRNNTDFLYCVDPHASWLPQRLARLKRKGIYCTVL